MGAKERHLLLNLSQLQMVLLEKNGEGSSRVPGFGPTQYQGHKKQSLYTMGPSLPVYRDCLPPSCVPPTVFGAKIFAEKTVRLSSWSSEDVVSELSAGKYHLMIPMIEQL